jgi:hypothetical protein
MDNNIKQPNINYTANFINNTYDPLSYFDLYGNSVIIFIFMTLFVFLVYSYCKIMQTRESIADDWLNQRCKPQNIAFAGFITHPENTTAFQYTSDNFQYCVQDILRNISGYALQPFQFMIQALTDIFSKLSDSIQKTREATNKLRNGITNFTQDVLSRILNVMIPIQTMFISLLDTFQKIQGVMTSGLYTMLGSYYTLQSLMGAILELIIKLLIVLVSIIVGLWIMPFTWPAAASMTAVFLAIAIPLSIIIYFMTEVLHIKSSGIPKLRCFDRKTHIYLQDGSFKHIQDIKVNDVLLDKSIVTSKIKVTSEGLDMYNLNGIIVSESHIVRCDSNWIPVKYHPLAIKINNYNESYLYCLNTTSKTIVINNIIFTDWDELYDYNLEFICDFMKKHNLSHIDEGYDKNTKIKLKTQDVSLKDIKIGETLSTEGIVYGIVELSSSRNLGNKEPLYNLLVSNGIFQSGTEIFFDYNKNIDSLLDLRKNII